MCVRLFVIVQCRKFRGFFGVAESTSGASLEVDYLNKK